MSDPILWLRLVHILSATILFGTGLGIAYFMWRAHRAGDVATIAATAKHVVQADWTFTAPAVALQLISGLLLVHETGRSLSEGWILMTLVLFGIAGVCWLPVLRLQHRLRDLAAAARDSNTPLPDAYRRVFRHWFRLGWPAFLAVIAIFMLMVLKPDLGS